MKSKILSIFFVVLIAQTQVAQGSPILNIFGDILGTVTNIATGIVTGTNNTISSAFQIALSLLTGILNGLVQIIGGIATKVTGDISIALGGVSQLVAGDVTGGILTGGTSTDGSSTGGTKEDTVAIAVAYLKDTAAQLAQIKDNALSPVSDFYSSVSSLLSNNTALLSNSIASIRQAIGNIKAELNSDDLFQAAVQIVYKGAGVAGNAVAPLAELLGNIVGKISTSVPLAVSTGYNALNGVAGKVNDVLSAASTLTDLYAKQAAASSQGLSTTVLPVTNELVTALNNCGNGVASIPAVVNSAITSMQNAGNELLAVTNTRRQEFVSAIIAVGSACSNDAATSVDAVSVDAISKAVECINNEISTLQNYQSQFQNNVGQYQFGVTTKTINISTLRQTVQNSIGFLLSLGSAKLRIDGCLANALLNFTVDLLPLAEYAITCTA